MLVLCCGNPERGDDGAAPRVAERLAGLGVAVRLVSGEALELVDAWSGAEEAIVVDAVVTGAPAGTIHVIDAGARTWGSGADAGVRPTGSTHGLGLAEAIELARVLGRLPRQLRIYGIEGGCFAVGAEMSGAVARAAEEVACRIAAVVT